MGAASFPCSSSDHARMPSTGPADLSSDPNCLECRVTGTIVFAATSAYSFYQRSCLPASQRGNRAFVAMVGTGMLGLSVWRAVDEAPHETVAQIMAMKA